MKLLAWLAVLPLFLITGVTTWKPIDLPKRTTPDTKWILDVVVDTTVIKKVVLNVLWHHPMEYAMCLYGYLDGRQLIVAEARVPHEISHQAKTGITYSCYPNSNYVGTIHSHPRTSPVKDCQASNMDVVALLRGINTTLFMFVVCVDSKYTRDGDIFMLAADGRYQWVSWTITDKEWEDYAKQRSRIPY